MPKKKRPQRKFVRRRNTAVPKEYVVTAHGEQRKDISVEDLLEVVMMLGRQLQEEAENSEK